MPVVLLPAHDKRSAVPQPPLVLPRKKRQERRVFLEPEVWAALDEIAEFHGDVFKRMGADEAVSRNDIISAFLTWANQEYWADKGGRPSSKDDWTEKVRRHAEKLSKIQR